jgi:hypothetical protein
MGVDSRPPARVDAESNAWTTRRVTRTTQKTMQVQTTKEFTDPRNESFKTEPSGDGGVSRRP